MRKIQRVGFLTGGGDAPGLNASIKSCVKRLTEDYNCQVIGIKDGYRGLEQGNPYRIADNFDIFNNKEDVHFIMLNSSMVRAWDRHGGTNLGTSRTNPYSDLIKSGSVFISAKERVKKVLDNVSALKLDGLILAGGEDTQTVSANLAKDNIPVIGIPKTIDKDLWGTDYTIGFETAVQNITDAIDKLRTTAGSHKRLFIVETMGRHAGHLALQGGSGAFIILIPEVEYEINKIIDLSEKYKTQKARYAILVVAEGAREKGGENIIREDNEKDEFGHEQLGGVAVYLKSKLEGKISYSIRHQVLGHLQRGGAPVSYDRRMGGQFGNAAANLMALNRTGRMVASWKGEITNVPLEEILGKLNLVNVDKEYDTERYNCGRSVTHVAKRFIKQKK